MLRFPRLFAHLVVATLIGSAVAWSATAPTAKPALNVRLDPSGKIQVSHGGQSVVNYEMLQLVDRTKGWHSLFGYGASKAVQRKTSPQALQVSFAESLDPVLSYTKTVTVSAESAVWDLAYSVPPEQQDKDAFYFIDIPKAVLTGALYQARAAGRDQFGSVEETSPQRMVTAPESVTFVTPQRRLVFDLTAQGATWLLTNWSASDHKSYRLRVESKVGPAGLAVRLGVKLRVLPSSPEMVAALKARAREAKLARARARLGANGCLNEEPLRVGSVKLSRTEVGQYAKVEMTFAVGGTYTNPFDPQQIDVAADIRTPSGKRILMPAFFYQDFRRTEDGIQPVRTFAWQVRFAPVEVGRHTFRIVAANRGQRDTGAEGHFTCRQRQARGHVRVSKANPLALEFGNGEPYFPSGINLFVSTRLGSPIPANRLDQCERWMGRLAEHGGNFVRLRMDSWWLAIEMTPDDSTGYLGLGYYHQQTCWEVDRIYDLAAKRGLYVMHCLDNANGNVNASKQPWRVPYDLYLKANGGVCDKPQDFWAHPEARRFARNKLRYCVARWGWHPHLMSWEYWNEVSCRPNMIDDATAWHRDMSRYLRSIDPYDHPITTSLMGDKALADRIWALPEIEIAQFHNYSGRDTAQVITDMTRKVVDKHHKPFFLGEYGVGPAYRPQGFGFDKDGLHLHNGMWAAAFAGGAGAGAFWYVSNMLDARDLYYHYRGFADFADRVPWNHAALTRCVVGEPTFVQEPAQLHYVDLPLPMGRRHSFEKPKVTDFTIRRDGTMAGSEMLRGMLHCAEGRKAPPTFHLELERPAQFIIHVHRSVGDDTNKLVVRLDNKTVADAPFPASKEADPKSEYVEQYGNWRTPYDKRVVVQVPAGRHSIRPEAVGKDRLEVHYMLRGVVSFEHSQPLRILGLRTDRSAYLWVQNRSSIWWTLYRGKQPTALPAMVTKLRGLPDGSYRVTWWDTWRARPPVAADAKCSAGVMNLVIPPVDRDVACLIQAK